VKSFDCFHQWFGGNPREAGEGEMPDTVEEVLGMATLATSGEKNGEVSYERIDGSGKEVFAVGGGRRVVPNQLNANS
jgi:hypothetical protein